MPATVVRGSRERTNLVESSGDDGLSGGSLGHANLVPVGEGGAEDSGLP